MNQSRCMILPLHCCMLACIDVKLIKSTLFDYLLLMSFLETRLSVSVLLYLQLFCQHFMVAFMGKNNGMKISALILKTWTRNETESLPTLNSACYLGYLVRKWVHRPRKTWTLKNMIASACLYDWRRAHCRLVLLQMTAGWKHLYQFTKFSDYFSICNHHPLKYRFSFFFLRCSVGVIAIVLPLKSNV